MKKMLIAVLILSSFPLLAAAQVPGPAPLRGAVVVHRVAVPRHHRHFHRVCRRDFRRDEHRGVTIVR
jgi:hypothetical protein